VNTYEAMSGTMHTRHGVFRDVQRHGHCGKPAAPRIRLAGLLLLGAHLLLVGCLTLRPLAVPWVEPGNLQPLATIRPDLRYGTVEALWRLGDGLLLLAPLGVLLPLASGRLHRSLAGTVARTVVVGMMVSLGIGLAQSAVPGHVINVDTMLLNTTGVALAAVFLFPPVRALLRSRTGAPGVLLREEAALGRTPDRAGPGMAPWAEAVPSAPAYLGNIRAPGATKPGPRSEGVVHHVGTYPPP
jgi:hypothetical protein